MITVHRGCSIYHSANATDLLYRITETFLQHVLKKGTDSPNKFIQEVTLYRRTFLVASYFRSALSVRTANAKEVCDLPKKATYQEKEKHFDLLHPAGITFDASFGSFATEADEVARRILSMRVGRPTWVRWAIARLPDYPMEEITRKVLLGDLPTVAVDIRRNATAIHKDDVEKCRVPVVATTTLEKLK